MSEAEELMRQSALRSTVRDDKRRVLDWRDKAVQPDWYGRTAPEVSAISVCLDDLHTPMMTLDRSALDGNLAAMAHWCREAGVSLAPHGKTTMAPQLWCEQLDAGCWGITVANEPQLRVARAAGVHRVVMANMFLRPEGLRWLREQLDAEDAFEFYCWVDSVEAARLMDASLGLKPGRRRVNVLVEVGHHGARTGVRSVQEGLAIARAVNAAPSLCLAGVAGFEGAIVHATDTAALAVVDSFLGTIVDLHKAVLPLYETEEVLLSAGGSAFFDIVARTLVPEARTGPRRVRVVLRSGGYLSTMTASTAAPLPAAGAPRPTSGPPCTSGHESSPCPKAEPRTWTQERGTSPTTKGCPRCS